MTDFIILALVIGLTAFIVFRYVRHTKEGKCSGCTQNSCSDCPSAKTKK